MLRVWVLAGLSALLGEVLAIGQTNCVSFKSSASSFSIVSKGKAAPIYISADDWPGVQRAAGDFATDIQRVTNVKPRLTNATASSVASNTKPIIVGTLGKSALIDQVVNATGLDVSGIKGQWESFIAQEVANPLPGVKSAYVIIGADKRGTIFALYDHSEQFGESSSSASRGALLTFYHTGVSPWHWLVSVSVYIYPAILTSGPRRIV